MSSHAGGRDVPSSTRSASTIVADTASGHHILKIDCYSRTMGTPTGERLMSRPFAVGGHSWRVAYYPNGDHSGREEYISLFLVLDDDVDKPVMAQFLFTFAGPGDTTTTTMQKPAPSAWLCASVCSFPSRGVWGFSEFIRKQDLVSLYLRDDCFTVRCDVAVINELRTEDTPEIGLPTFISVPPSNLHKQLGDLLHNGKGSDIVFEVGCEKFAAHRCVLATRSPVFDELFGTMEESSGTSSSHLVRIDDMEAKVFKAFLYFVYTDSLAETPKEDDDVVFFQHLILAADRYNVLRLKLMCEEKLCRFIDVRTVANILMLAERHYCIGLKLACFRFLSSPANLRAVMASDDFDHLYNSCPSTMKELIAKLGVEPKKLCDVQCLNNCGYFFV